MQEEDKERGGKKRREKETKSGERALEREKASKRKRETERVNEKKSKKNENRVKNVSKIQLEFYPCIGIKTPLNLLSIQFVNRNTNIACVY